MVHGCLRTAVLAVVVASAAAASPSAPGVRVAEVEASSAWAAAGAVADDLLLAWRAEDEEHPVRHVLDWWWVESAVAPCQLVGVKVEGADGRGRWVDVPVDRGGLNVRPRFAADESELRGLLGTALDADGGDAATEALAVAVGRLRESDRAAEATWLLLERASSARDGPRLEELLQDADALVADAADWRAAVAARWGRGLLLLAGRRVDDGVGELRELVADLRNEGPAAVLRIRVAASLGKSLHDLGRLDEAELALGQAVDIAETHAPSSPLRVAVLCELGDTRLEKGDVAGSSSVYETAHELARKIAPNGEVLSDTLGGLAMVAYARGETSRAEELFTEQLELRHRLGTPPDVLAYSLQNLGVVAAAQRRLDRAQQYLERAAEMHELADPDDSGMAIILGNAAVLAQYRGDLLRSEELLERAAAIYEACCPDSLDRVPIYINLGKLAAEQGNHRAAERWYLQGIEKVRAAAPGSEMLPVLLINMGELRRRQERFSEALELESEALDALRAAGGAELRTAVVRENIGRLLIELGRQDEAAAQLEAALASSRSEAPGSTEEAEVWNAMGLLASASKNELAAVERHRRAADLVRQAAPGTWKSAQIHHDLARALRRVGRRDRAIEAGYAAVDAMEQQVRRLGATEAVRASFRSRYADAYHELQEDLVATGKVAEALHVLERSRARSLLTMLAERDLVPADDDAAELDARRKLLGDEHDALLEKLAHATPREREALLEERDGLLRHEAELREEIRRRSPRLAMLRYPEPLSAADAAASLPPGTILLCYSVGDVSTLLYAVARDRAPAAWTIPAGRLDLEGRAGMFVGLLSRPPVASTRETVAAAGQALYSLLLAPAAERLASAKRLLVVPDGPLRTLPFAALRDPGGRYLVEELPVANVDSMTVLSRLRGGGGRAVGHLLAAGDPWLPTSARAIGAAALRGGAGRSLGELPGARREAQEVTALWGTEATCLVGRAASEGEVRRAAASADVLHMATHAVVDDRSPMSSALVLAPDEDDEHHNGLLQAWEIVEGLRLDARLVTLSGCETGLGRELRGEGVLGLTRAFQLAGARAVLHTLWKVEDRAQAELMVRVYAGLKEGLAVDEAVRRAQLSFFAGPVELPPSPVGWWQRLLDRWGLLPARSADLSAPYYWAALRLDGRW